MIDEETAAIMELQSMTRYELLKVDHELAKWHCCIADCDKTTRILDFGISPIFYHGTRWLNISSRIFLCGKHWKQYKNMSQYNWPQKNHSTGLELITFNNK